MKLPHKYSQFLHGTFAPLLPGVMSLRLGAYSRAGGLATVPVHDHGERDTMVVAFEKTPRGRLKVGVDLDKLLSHRLFFSSMWRRGGVFVDLLSDPKVKPGVYRCELNDRVLERGPVLAFCSSLPETVLVPDRGFALKGGYAKERKIAANATANWHEREGTVLWRGNHSGEGKVFTETMSPDDSGLIQRARMCLIAKGMPGADIRFAVGDNWRPDVAEKYRAAGIAGGFIAQSQWLNQKFAIDVDGNANAFSNFYVRMLYGCCVLKVASPLGYRQWYYDDLEPWVHYVPVAADLSDLRERIAWCQDNDDACRQIAANARQFSHERTVETERRRSVERIVRAYS